MRRDVPVAVAERNVPVLTGNVHVPAPVKTVPVSVIVAKKTSNIIYQDALLIQVSWQNMAHC